MSVNFEKVQEIIADALYVDKEECTKDATLIGDLGAESIDFLDIIFRLEQEFGVKLPKGEVERNARGNLSDEEFAINGVIQPQGLENLRKAVPGAHADQITEGMLVRDIPSLFTVETFLHMVEEKLAAKAEGSQAVASSSPQTTLASPTKG